ncbi:exosortase A, partial [Duganella callida]
MILERQPAVSELPSARHPEVRTPLLVALLLLLPVLLFAGTAQSIVSIWERSETFAHGYIILPMSIWLVWRRRALLARLPAAPYWPGLILLAMAAAAWLLGSAGDVLIVQQYALAAMMPLMVLTVLGRRIALGLAFPLLYVLLAVPFGDSLIPPLVHVTATATVEALRLSGIPVWSEGTNFSIPSGSWSVVDACSGVRYLIASFTLGALYAHLSYRKPRKWIMFMTMAIIVPILANVLRAYIVVILGHLSGMTLATGFDHLVYGWVLFGIVMFLLFWAGSHWRDEMPEDAPSDAPPASAPLPRAATAPG